MPRGVAESHQLRGPEVPDLASLPPAPARHSPCVMDLISMVLGMRSSEVGCTDFRLILDLKRVLIKVDFPKPLCPGERTGLVAVALQRGQVTGLRCSDAWACPPAHLGWGWVRGRSGGRRVPGWWPSSHSVLWQSRTRTPRLLTTGMVKLPHVRPWGAREELRCRTLLGRQSGGLAPPVQLHP